MSVESEVVFGIREVSWPKREGYLYVRISGSKAEHPLASFHLYKTKDDEFERLLATCLKDWTDLPLEQPYVLENFSTHAEMLFRNAWRRLRAASEGI